MNPARSKSFRARLTVLLDSFVSEQMVAMAGKQDSLS